MHNNNILQHSKNSGIFQIIYNNYKFMYQFYSLKDAKNELCYNVESDESLEQGEIEILSKLLADGFVEKKISKNTGLRSEKMIEIGPNLSFATSFSTNAVSVCHNCGLKKITRIEKSERYVLDENQNENEFLSQHCDRMTETKYDKTLESFESNKKTDVVYEVKIIENGIDALKKINKDMGLGMDSWDEEFYYNLFLNDIKRNPTSVECFQLGQANSEHSRHWFFRGKIIIDGKEMKETLFQAVQYPLKQNISNSLIAFKDNSSAIRGYDINTIVPESTVKSSAFMNKKCKYHFIFTAETHNFPTGVSPFSGAATGGGGRIRDVQATGKGALVVAGTAGYAVGNLNIPGYQIAGENMDFKYPENKARPLKIQIQASDGASDYGNKFGEPLIQGFNRSFGLKLPDGSRQEWIKPIMFSGGIGQIDDGHIKKDSPKIGMLIIQVGGPVYRIGMGGGSASSMIQGENKVELDFNAVQRGDAEIEQKMNRVIRACVEMGEDNPIISIHDQGAGGPCNVLTELIEPIGGKVEIRNIKVGDKTMSVLEIWGNESQERNALIIESDKLEIFSEICNREKSDYELLGEVTGDRKIIVHDNKDDSTPVNLELAKILGEMPQKEFHDKRVSLKLSPLKIPVQLTFQNALNNVLKLLSVCSKRFLVTKVDRSVTGLIAQQQCCGPLQLPVSDVAIIAQTHFDKSGAAISIGEQPIKILVNPKAGSRMSVGEAMTNIVSAKISALEDIKCSGNWMWPAKLPGEGARIYDAALAMRDIMVELGIAIDGGKDSLSMANKVDKEIVKSPGELAVSAYVSMPDVEKAITPDIKKPGSSEIWVIDLGKAKYRLGGSALAQTLSQIGDESPDVDDVRELKNLFLAIQELIEKDLLLSGHDRSDGGLATTLLEMAFAGNCGLEISSNANTEDLSFYFNEELGYVMEIDKLNIDEFLTTIKKYNLEELTFKLGHSAIEKTIIISHNNKEILSEKMIDLRQTWEETSYQLNRLQTNSRNADYEKENIYQQKNPLYKVTFKSAITSQTALTEKNKPRVAIIREEGSNGDREMASAFHLAGFETWDIKMSDLIDGNITLDKFRGLAFVGGFSYADALGSAKGWAGGINFNLKLKEAFDIFYDRKDTFSLGVCNGCQLMSLIGWLPWKNINVEKQPRFIVNESKRFESRWISVSIKESPSIMLKGMEGSTLGVWVAHGEGRLYFPDSEIYSKVIKQKLNPLVYVDDNGEDTEKYPFNPNGSVNGIASLCSPDGRHLAMMPHPERAFLKWQWPWMPEELSKDLEASPWLSMFQNAYKWVKDN